MGIPADQLAVMEMLGRAFVDYEKQTGARCDKRKLLCRLSDALDLDYLTKRVRDEQGDLQALLDAGWD